MLGRCELPFFSLWYYSASVPMFAGPSLCGGLCPRCLLQPPSWMVIAGLCCTTTSVSRVLYTVFHCAVQVDSQIAQSTPQYQSGLYLLHEDGRSHHLWCVWCKSVLEACSGLQVP